MRKLYINGSAHIPERFWTLSKMPKTESGHERPEKELNETELARYNDLLIAGQPDPCLGDVLDRFRKK